MDSSWGLIHLTIVDNVADGLWLSTLAVWRGCRSDLVEEVFSAPNTSSESVEVGPGFPFEVTIYWVAGGRVYELSEVRGRGLPLLRPYVVDPRWLVGMLCLKCHGLDSKVIPLDSLFLKGCWWRNKATRNITLLGKLDRLEISSQVCRGYT